MKPLKPVMAALLAAASATTSSPRTAFATTPPKRTVPAAADCLKSLADATTDPVNALTCLVQKKPEARKDIGDRLADFAQGTAAGRQYMTTDLLKDAEQLKLAVAEAKGWPEANKKTPATVAVLYFVVGPASDTLPAWAQVPAITGKFKTKMGWADRLAEALTTAHWSDSKQVSQQDTANATAAFLNDAAVWAKKVMDDHRSKGDLTGSVADHNTTAPVIPTVPPGVGNLGDPNRATFGAGFSTQELYGDGEKVYAPGDDGFRQLSVKIYTVRNDDGSLQNMIGIVDITDPSAPYKPQFVPVTATGPQKISLRSGGRPYVVDVEGDNVTVSRDGTKPGEGASINTTLSGLYNKRAEQCRSAGTVRIPDEPNGTLYYAISQANVVQSSPKRDARGDLLFFKKSDIDNPQSNPRLLRPVSICSVRMVDQDGVTVPVTWNPSMGTMPDGVNPDGTQKMSPFYMALDAKTGMWKPVRGNGDPDPAKAKPAPAPGDGTTPPTDGTTPPPGGVTPPGNPADPNSPYAGMDSLDTIVGYAKKVDPPWADADNSGFTPEIAKKLHIMTSMAGNDRVFAVFFDPTMKVKGNQFAFQPVIGGDKLKLIRSAAGKYVVMQFAKMWQYFDYQVFARYVSGDKTAQPAYIWTPEPGIQAVDSVDVALDMMKAYKTVDPKLPAAVRANVKKFAPKGDYKLSGSATTLAMTFGDSGSAEVWPKGILKAADTGSNDGMAEQKGPGTIYNLAGGGTGPFQKTVNDGNWSTDGGGLVDEGAGYALYVGKEPSIDKSGKTVMRKRYGVMIRYKKNNNPVLSKLITVFGDKGDTDYFAKPAEVHMQGYPNTELGDTSLLRMFVNSTEEKGAISAYTTPASPGNARDPKRNCVGPVIWWGMTKGQAQESCQTDSKADD